MNCNELTSATIGGVTEIGFWLFANCSKLTKIYYAASESGWNKISVDSNNADLADATRYYYSATQPTTDGNYWRYDENGAIVEW